MERGSRVLPTGGRLGGWPFVSSTKTKSNPHRAHASNGRTTVNRSWNSPPALSLLLIFALAGTFAGHARGAWAASAREAPPAADAPTLDDFRWLVGTWEGEGFGGVCEEVWSQTAGDAMMGMFRLVTDDQVVFYEFMRIVEQDGAITLELKHFSPDFVSWEEKAETVRFALKSVGEGFATFSGLTMERTGEDGLEIVVTLGQPDGSTVDQRVVLRRSRPTDP